MSVLRVCHQGEKQRSVWRRTHQTFQGLSCETLALSAEKLCEHVQDSDTLFDCLKEHKKDLPPECLASEPCLDESSKKCKLTESNEWGAEKTLCTAQTASARRTLLASARRTRANPLAPSFLQAMWSRLCQQSAVRVLQVLRAVADPDKCNEPYAHHLGTAPDRSPVLVLRRIHRDRPWRHLVSRKRRRHACVAQRRIHERDPKVCPLPKMIASYRRVQGACTRLRKATFSLRSFMRDIFHTALGPPPPPPPPRWAREGLPPPPPRWAREGSRLRFAEDPYRPRPLIDRPPPPRPFKEGHQSAFDNVASETQNFIQPPVVAQRANKGKRSQEGVGGAEKPQKHFEKEMTMERNEIDRERKVLKLEQKLTNPKSSWNIVNDMHLVI